MKSLKKFRKIEIRKSYMKADRFERDLIGRDRFLIVSKDYDTVSQSWGIAFGKREKERSPIIIIAHCDSEEEVAGFIKTCEALEMFHDQIQRL